MTKIDVAHSLILMKLGFKNGTKEDKNIIQKKIYMLKSLGTDLGHDFIWYIYGPYSPSFADYINENYDYLSLFDYSDYVLNKSSEENISVVNNLEFDNDDDFLSILSWYKLLASVLFIWNNSGSWNANRSRPRTILKELIKQMPEYSLVQCEKAFSILKKRKILKYDD